MLTFIGSFEELFWKCKKQLLLFAWNPKNDKNGRTVLRGMPAQREYIFIPLNYIILYFGRDTNAGTLQASKD